MPQVPEKSPNPYARPPEAVREPPTGFWQSLRYLGPSFILIGSIVGSGELVLTTAFGARVGFVGLWFILLACVCKTVLQAELGRYTICSGDTALEALDRVPGPRVRASWLVWLWVLWQVPSLISSSAILGSTGQVLAVAFPAVKQEIWGILLAVVTMAMLLVGKYQFLERTSLFLVISFSVITVAGAVALQLTPEAVPLAQAIDGLSIRIQPLIQQAVLATTVAAFAATGVSAGELLGYTYWCVEKGYARSAGVDDGSEAWVRRARGWVRVMQVDVWLATVIFTVTTAAFFWLGAGVLHPKELIPNDQTMIPTLQQIYTRTLGPWAAGLFLVGAFFVLYSTIFSGTASAGRIYADALGVMKVVDFHDFTARKKWIRIFTVAVPLVQCTLFALHKQPATMLVFGGVMTALMIPVLAWAVVWLRYRQTDRRLAPSRWTDALLWPSVLVVSTVSLVFLWFQGSKVLDLMQTK